MYILKLRSIINTIKKDKKVEKVSKPSSELRQDFCKTKQILDVRV